MTTRKVKWREVKAGDRVVLPVSEVTGRLGKRIFVSIDEHDDWAFLEDAEVEVVEGEK